MLKKKIIIVGGGSAGWMTAATLCKVFPQFHITLVESPNIPISGVGESTIAGIHEWINLVGINEQDFMKATDATYKLSIRFDSRNIKDRTSNVIPSLFHGVYLRMTRSVWLYVLWGAKQRVVTVLVVSRAHDTTRLNYNSPMLFLGLRFLSKVSCHRKEGLLSPA